MYNTNIRNLKGENGSLLIADTAQHTGSWDSIQALADSVVNLVSDNMAGNLSAVQIPKGVVIYGSFTQITAASGTLVAYSKCP